MQRTAGQGTTGQGSAPPPSSGDRGALVPALADNLKRIRKQLGASGDIVIREITLGSPQPIRAAVLYTDGLADKQIIHESILPSLMTVSAPHSAEPLLPETGAALLARIQDTVLQVGELKAVPDLAGVLREMLSGNTVVLVDGVQSALSVGTPGWKDRAISEPAVQNVIRGPRESFTETLRTNTALVRRRIRDERLRCEQRAIGSVTHTEIAIMYVDGLADPSVLQEIDERLGRIRTDAILEGGYIEEFIQDKTLTPFPTLFNSERPDVIAAGLLEGRVAILIDGTPFVLLVPALFNQFFQSAEDYYQRADIAIFLRILRYLSFFIALLGPSLYIAVTTFHQDLLPTQLLISLASQREGIPFPAFVEAMMMEIAFEILREAGIRMPKAIGQAVSIVGALVIGQAAVEAGIVSAAMVIVVSLTAISNFVFPSFNMAISVRILRFGMMLLAATFGFFGVTIGLLALVIHLCSLRSFGVPYMAPFGPYNTQDQEDAIFRLPHRMLNKRPQMVNTSDAVRDRTPDWEPEN
ncbi:GerA spore germination protein [Paenibacillus mucilaginosus 3016]|uniref:GerA spore germination protein n=2 Tax=Paenibacillus mucilaginosus TaxID=61624 RepID=H6N974_9BACL|nr:spore germination protein [Paenibacillus mucilaginosus]AFC27820.1 GerA spore germination protein [Paenibacillus mucilaginosus 3016]AFH59973.1 spore germination protein KA [Paenibacillus mucilaginosus K02]WFA16688.1 spore germination protein [Paenibacillus mucilaginosus]